MNNNDEFRARRHDRNWAQQRLRQYAYSEAISMCGILTDPPMMPEIRKRSDGRAYPWGVKYCASPWACPWCSPRIATERAAEVSELVDRARERGLRATLVSLAIRYCADGDLREMLPRLADCWREFTDTRWWRFIQEDDGPIDWVYGIECTHDNCAWCLRVHALVFLAGSHHRFVCPEFRETWEGVVERVLGKKYVPDDLYHIDEYYRVSAEVIGAGSDVHKFVFDVSGGRRPLTSSRRSPWQIAFRIAESIWPRVERVMRWDEWQRATHGRHPLTWSKGAIELLGRDPRSDAECAVERMDPVDTVVATFTPLEWRAIMGTGALSTLLDVAERGTSKDVYETANWIVREQADSGDLVAYVARALWQHPHVFSRPPFADILADNRRIDDARSWGSRERMRW